MFSNLEMETYSPNTFSFFCFQVMLILNPIFKDIRKEVSEARFCENQSIFAILHFACHFLSFHSRQLHICCDT